jgi:hypothetical protein
VKATMDIGNNSRMVRLPEFDGAHNAFQVWWTRFMAFAAVMRITQVLKIGGEAHYANI